MTRQFAIKNATILAKAAYPPLSTWEFKHVTTEQAVRDRLNESTIYFVVQRPMLWFDNLDPDSNPLRFEIVDGSGQRMQCLFDVYRALGLDADDVIDIEFGYHRNEVSEARPLRHVAGIRIYRRGDFVAWWSPAKLLFEISARDLPVRAAGDISAFTDYDVHYIGQAYDQKIWKRLEAHRRLQDVLTEKDIRGDHIKRNALEVSLITLEIIGVDEYGYDASVPFPLPAAYEPIIHEVGADPASDTHVAFTTQWMIPGNPAATNELEAMLIEMFRPRYNKIKFSKYPNIKSGARNLGYTYTDVAITDFPFRLKDVDGNEPLMDAD